MNKDNMNNNKNNMNKDNMNNKNIKITEAVFNFLEDGALAADNAGVINKEEITELRCVRDVANMNVRCATVNNIIVNKSRIIKKYRAQLASDKLTDEKRQIVTERLAKAMSALERAKATLIAANVKMREKYNIELLDNADLVILEKEQEPEKQTAQISEDDVNRANAIVKKYEEMKGEYLIDGSYTCDNLVHVVRTSIDSKDRADVNDLLKQYAVRTKTDRAVKFEGKKYNLRGLESRVFRYLNSDELKAFAQAVANTKGADSDKFMTGFANCVAELSFYLTHKEVFQMMFDEKHQTEMIEQDDDASNVNDVVYVDNVNHNHAA